MSNLRVRSLQGWMALHTLVYRLSGGRLLNLDDHIILLATIGRRSGRLRVAPLYSIRDGEAYIVIGSYGGGATNPAWYHNLMARPRALVHDRGQSVPVSAEAVVGDAYERQWDALVSANPAYGQYRSRTDRPLPIMRLCPA